MQVKLNLIAAAAAAIFAGSVSAQDMVVKIGHVGPTAAASPTSARTTRTAPGWPIDELNAKGVTIGGKKAKFELVAEDDAGDPKQGTAVANKLVDAKVNGVIGHLNSAPRFPRRRSTATPAFPQISPSATNPKYTRQGFKTTFRVVADDVHLGGTLGRYAVKELKGKSIVTIDDRTAYGQGVAEEFAKAVKARAARSRTPSSRPTRRPTSPPS
jgi:branched-chain amino acid transport system substrate-binding protein